MPKYTGEVTYLFFGEYKKRSPCSSDKRVRKHCEFNSHFPYMKRYKFTIEEAIEIIHQPNRNQKMAMSSWYAEGRPSLWIPECLMKVIRMKKPVDRIYYQVPIWTGD